MALTAVHHIALLVSDYQKSKEFYVDKLGFRIVRENFREDRGDYKLDLILNGVELEIFAPSQKDHEYKIHPERPNFPEAYGLRHLAFCVDSVEQTVRELRELGIECEPIRVDSYTDKKMTFFHDPDGLPLELHE